MTTKKGHCPNCCTWGALFSKEFRFSEDGSWEEVWECTNCLHEIPVRKRGHRTERMTKSQERLVQQLPEEAKEYHYSETATIENLKVELHETGAVFLSFQVTNGKPGTAGSVFPDRYSFSIGRNGGLSSYLFEDGKLTKVTGRSIWKHRQS
jgi:hypothetical protein